MSTTPPDAGSTHRRGVRRSSPTAETEAAQRRSNHRGPALSVNLKPPPPPTRTTVVTLFDGRHHPRRPSTDPRKTLEQGDNCVQPGRDQPAHHHRTARPRRPRMSAPRRTLLLGQPLQGPPAAQARLHRRHHRRRARTRRLRNAAAPAAQPSGSSTSGAEDRPLEQRSPRPRPGRNPRRANRAAARVSRLRR